MSMAGHRRNVLQAGASRSSWRARLVTAVSLLAIVTLSPAAPTAAIPLESGGQAVVVSRAGARPVLDLAGLLGQHSVPLTTGARRGQAPRHGSPTETDAARAMVVLGRWLTGLAGRGPGGARTALARQVVASVAPGIVRGRSRTESGAPLPPLAPSLGPSPPPCNVLVYGATNCLLQSWVATFSLDQPIVKPGDRLTGTVAPHCDKKCVGNWAWSQVPIVGRPVTPCRDGQDTTCTWQILTTTASLSYTVVIMNYGTWAGHAESRAFYAVNAGSIIEGVVHDDDGNPITHTNVIISGPRSWRAVTDLNGFYNAILPPGDYSVTPQVASNLMGPGDHVEAQRSADCTPTGDGSVCLVHLRRDHNRTANFVVPACRVEPKDLLGWKIKAKCPQHFKDGVSDVQITPPSGGLGRGLSSLAVATGFATPTGDGAYTLSYKLPMKDRSHLFEPIVLPDLSVNAGSLSLTASGISIDEGGLAIDMAGFSVGSAVSGLIYDLAIGHDGVVMAGSLELDIYGTTLDAANVRVDASGISANPVTIGLPPALGGSSVTVSGFRLDAGGAVHGVLDGFNLALANGALSGRIEGMRFTATGLAADHAHLHLNVPGTANGCDFDVTGLSYDSSGLHVASADVTVALDVKAIHIAGHGHLDLPPSPDGSVQYHFQGSVTVEVNDLFRAAASLEIGPVNAAQGHPSQLYNAAFDVQLNGRGIPLGNTGLVLTGLGGVIGTSTGTGGGVIWTFGLKAGLATGFDGGRLFSGAIGGALSNDGNIGLSGSGLILQYIHLDYAGFCARLFDEPDTVCDTLGLPAPARGRGVVVAAHGAMDLSVPGLSWVGPTAHVDLTLYGQLQATPQFYLQAGMTGTATLQSRLVTGQAQASGLFGRFQRPGGPVVVGLKGHLSGSIVVALPGARPRTLAIDQWVFVDTNGAVSLEGVDQFQLVQPTAARRVYLVAVPPAAPLGGQGPLPALVLVAPARAEPATPVSGDEQGDRRLASGITPALAEPAAVAPTSTATTTAVPTSTGTATSTSTATATSTSTATPRPTATASPSPTITVTPTPRPIVASFRLPRGQTDTLMSLSWQAGAPTLTLVAPTGQHITPDHPGAGVYPVVNSGGNSVILYLPRPPAGRWQVRVGNVHGGEHFVFTMSGSAPQPTLRVVTPRRGQTLGASAAHPRVLLAGRLTGGAARATVALYYTTAPTLGRGRQQVPNYAGRLLASAVPVRGGAWRYSWDTRALPSGRYYVYAVLNNGTGPLVVGYGAGAILVRQPARPGGPRTVRAVQRGATLTVQWQPPVQAALVAGYVVRWQGKGVGAGPWRSVDVGPVRRAVLRAPWADLRYAVAVAAYDVAGHQSAWVAARLSGGPISARPKPKPKPRPRGKPKAHPKPKPRPHGMPQVGAADGQVRTWLSGRRARVRASTLLIRARPASFSHPARRPCRPAPGQGHAGLLVFDVYQSTKPDGTPGTPQIAFNDAAAITGCDYSTNPPTEAQTWNTTTHTWVPYGAHPRFAVLTNGKMVRSDKTPAQRRYDAGCKPSPFTSFEPRSANASNTTLPKPPQPSVDTWTSCDEYPFASSTDGGGDAIIRGVLLEENRQQGRDLSSFVLTKGNAVKLHADDGRFQVCVHLTRQSPIGGCDGPRSG